MFSRLGSKMNKLKKLGRAGIRGIKRFDKLAKKAIETGNKYSPSIGRALELANQGLAVANTVTGGDNELINFASQGLNSLNSGYQMGKQVLGDATRAQSYLHGLTNTVRSGLQKAGGAKGLAGNLVKSVIEKNPKSKDDLRNAVQDSLVNFA